MANKRLLLLEDDAVLSDFLRLHLEQHGYEVVQAVDSRDVLKLIQMHQPDLVITDLVMPEHEGIEGICKILANCQLPILAMSGYPGYLDLTKPLVQATLLKPFTGEQLVAKVDELLALS